MGRGERTNETGDGTGCEDTFKTTLRETLKRLDLDYHTSHTHIPSFTPVPLENKRSLKLGILRLKIHLSRPPDLELRNPGSTTPTTPTTLS